MAIFLRGLSFLPDGKTGGFTCFDNFSIMKTFRKPCLPDAIESSARTLFR